MENRELGLFFSVLGAVKNLCICVINITMNYNQFDIFYIYTALKGVEHLYAIHMTHGKSVLH